ncbi:DUF4962 domain-containing protein [Paenibacillus flagellatus]|uniref:Heparinase II N-terminal domain-containing protein n=1 Tax=Paenibacillus flagellatus TaxID=2211139 RepID=A0A2V5KAE4_9BACL|nr:DUF4962 domain-containing protein [Paenibacillus flagellatus]PYI56549.1 hypothetical protein DLM86_06155 [Paenibacillus flagellatus]
MTFVHRPDLSGAVAVNAIASTMEELDYEIATQGDIVVSFRAAPGLYQLSIIADATGFDWERLYVNLFSYQNRGQRTGPWDFHPTEGARALLPSYWVHVDDRPVGLWYFQRVSVDDLTHRRFRGRMAFYIGEEGAHRLQLRPYNDDGNIRWLSALLETDPDDRLGETPDVPADWFERCPAAEWRDPAYWRSMRNRLSGSGREYEEALLETFEWLSDANNRTPETLPLLVAHYRLTNDKSALAAASTVIERALLAEHWGNPKPDGYGHDGDMSAMYVMWGLTHAYHALYDLLDDDTRSRMLDKLALQGTRFFEKALLYRDYWGGSLLQDHGWRSLFGFGSAAIHLLGLVPEASLWAAYVIPRIDRSLAAMPKDGVIPASSHFSLALYTELTVPYRNALLKLTGRDIYRDEAFPRIVDYVSAVVREADRTLVGWGRDKTHLVGGSAFLNTIASVHRDRRAAYLVRLLRGKRMNAFYARPEEMSYYGDALWGLLTHDETVTPLDEPERPAEMRHYEDSGVVHYRDEEQDLVLSVKCGPSMGYNAYRRAMGACDRLGLGPDAGHFMIAAKGEPFLVTPDGGYSLRTEIRSCLLVNGKGQKDDVGYTMSIPSYRYHGEEMESAYWDECRGKGGIRLNLASAYPEEAGIASYGREFILEKGRPIVVRDHIVMNAPNRLSWLFQTQREHAPRIAGLTCTLGREGGTGMTIVPRPLHLDLNAAVNETPVVWSYVSPSGFRPFDTIRYDTVRSVRCAVVEFVFAPTVLAR